MRFDVTSPAALPTRWGEFQVVAFRFAHEPQATADCEHLAIVKGDIRGADVLARVHSSCITGDVVGSSRCDCGPQLDAALEAIEREGRGVVLYLNQEGRGIGLFNKIRAYVEQDAGANTVEANVKLGFDADARSYEQAVDMLRHLGVASVRLMTNNPKKVEGLEAAGIVVSARVPHVAGHTPTNRLYIETKRDLMGHLLG
ncbi:MAG TPA: GTP cyclohydrolase II [Candidatus Thermoplasmatota archaeon]|nr:GTP cyclohydrolase II [Candidatus Thermoplasmatota archaeon]